jgi:PGF-CTERM protein
MNRDRLAVFLVVLVTLSMPGIAGAAAAGGGDGASADAPVTVTVTVTDDFGNGISDATVTAEWDGGSTEGTTRSSGATLLDVPEGETVQFTIDHVAYTRNNPVVVTNVSSGQQINITAFQKAEATVQVADSSGSPVENARVTLYKRGQIAANGRTDDDGRFNSGTIEQGDYRVIVLKSGYYRNRSDVTVEDTTEFSVNIEEGTVPVTVSVEDDHFSPPRAVVGATVDLEGIGTLQTAGDGTQTAAVPVNSEITVSVTKDGYTSASQTVEVDEESMDLAFTITREDALNMTVGSERVVTGSKVRVEVTDEYDRPVEGASVTVDGEEVGTTNDDGVYQVTLDNAGEFEIAASAEGVSSDAVTVEAVEPAAEDTPTATDAAETATATEGSDLPVDVPGFGTVTALLALLATVAVLRRRT